MRCTHPVDGWYAARPNDNGKRPIVFNRREGNDDEPVKLPCGRCLACRLEHSRQWALRCVHEASCHAENHFVTLTYDEEHLPKNWSLDFTHFQKFIRSVRKRTGKPIRYYACGEYGENQTPSRETTLGRPHFHALIFGHRWDDLELFMEDKEKGTQLWTSEKLTDTWGHGFASIGEVNEKTAGYTARYCTKKILGDEELADSHYQWTCKVTGEVTKVQPEKALMSLKPAIGIPWLEKYAPDLYKGYITHNGVQQAIPKAYERWLIKNEHSHRGDTYEDRRTLRIHENTSDIPDDDHVGKRLRDKDECLQSKTKILRRNKL